MKKIVLKFINFIVITILLIMATDFMYLLVILYLPKYLPKNPITISTSKTLKDGRVVVERFIQGTSIKHNITKIFDKEGNLIGITNYNYGVLQEMIDFEPNRTSILSLEENTKPTYQELMDTAKELFNK